MTAAWLRARGEQVEVLPAIDWHGVEFREAMAWDVDPGTGEARAGMAQIPD